MLSGDHESLKINIRILWRWDGLSLRMIKYSKIPIIRPPLRLSKSGLKDHFWTVPKVVSNQMHTGCRKWSKE